MENKIKYFAYMVGGLVVYTVIIVIITNCDVLGIETSNDWIGYYGSIAGGVLTLIGVYITIKHSEENRKDDFRNSIMPVLDIEGYYVGDTSNAGDIALYDKTLTNDADIESVCIKLIVSNIGMKAAKNLKIGAIDKDGKWQDIGANTLLKVGDSYTCNTGMQIYNLNKFEKERIKRTIVFSMHYQNLIGENYIQNVEVDLEPQEGGDNWSYFCKNPRVLEAEYIGNKEKCYK